MCACPRDKVIETYVGVRTLQERGVLMSSCVGVWGRERLLSLSRSPAISFTQAHTLCRVYISHTHKTSPPNVYLPSYVVLAHSPHTPPPLQTSTLCLLVHHSPLSISPTCGPAPAPPCIHICRDSFHSSLMYHRSRSRTLFSTPSILDLS